MPGDGTTLYAPKHAKGSNTKGGGYRGGPKRWTGSGPRPARHIPWPEIFKHHISVLEGHLKMVDMIRKHTVPDTGNWRTINQMVHRSHELLRMSKEATRSFVPPPDHRETVPIGSSSASMYPGYSPADHQYGEAAQEFGSEWSAAKAKGIEFKPAPDGPEYQFGQAKGVKKHTLAKIREAKAARGEGSGSGTGSGSGSGSDTGAPPAVSNGSTRSKVHSKAKAAEEKAENQSGDGNNPYFVIDVNPTPVNIPGVSVHLPKRTSEGQPEPATVEKKPKKSKREHEGSLPGAAEKKVEFEDISGEVDARLKEKEERRKQKEEKKRKRDSDGSTVAQATAEIPKPPKKKTKDTVEGKSTVEGTNTKKRVASAEGESPQDESKPKKKKSKKSKA